MPIFLCSKYSRNSRWASIMLKDNIYICFNVLFGIIFRRINTLTEFLNVVGHLTTNLIAGLFQCFLDDNWYYSVGCTVSHPIDSSHQTHYNPNHVMSVVWELNITDFLSKSQFILYSSYFSYFNRPKSTLLTDYIQVN